MNHNNRLPTIPEMQNKALRAVGGSWNGRIRTRAIRINPFRSPPDIIKYGKARMVQRLGLEQSPHDKQNFQVELQGFGDVPMFGNNSSAETDNTVRDDAGNLLSVLVTGGMTYLETEKTKAEAEKLQAQAVATQAVTGLQTARAGMGTVTPWVIGLLAVGLFMTLRK